MMSYVEDLGRRIKMFKDWVDKGQPRVYWVSGFFFTQSFFTGVLQDYARNTKMSIDLLDFKHYVMDQDFVESQCKSVGCYTYGLYLEAATWDSQKKCLSESIPKKVFFDMPTVSLSLYQIYFEPYIIKDGQSAQPTQTLQSTSQQTYYE